MSVRGSTLEGVTDAQGLFRMTAVPVGSRVVVVQHVAYGEHIDSVVVVRGAETRVQITISREAILLAPLTVEAASEAELSRRAAGTSINQILRPEIEDAGRRGLDLGTLLQESMPGVRVTPVGPRGALSEYSGSYCVEYRSGEARRGTPACREVTVYVDDIAVSSPSYLFSTLALQDIERLEMLGPGEAGTRYGNTSRGVL
ncbi:MAG: TonB-dependent receptor plug domain-containing protein [Gemmatimonadetes bacterium]|nr:TonB-dependent receptor plug domain-containing protein [Gemmatimonadota bacterium]